MKQKLKGLEINVRLKNGKEGYIIHALTLKDETVESVIENYFDLEKDVEGYNAKPQDIFLSFDALYTAYQYIKQNFINYQKNEK